MSRAFNLSGFVATDAFGNALASSIVEQGAPAKTVSDLGSGLSLTAEQAERFGPRIIDRTPLPRARLDSLIPEGERVLLSANSAQSDVEAMAAKLTELFYPKDGVRAGFSEPFPLLAAGPGYTGGLPAMPSPKETRTLVNDAMNVKQMRSRPFDEQRSVLGDLINARIALGDEAEIDSLYAKGKLSREEYRENINMRNALGQGIRMQYSTAKTTGAIEPGLYPEEMQGWGGSGINFGRGLRSMGARLGREGWEVDAPRIEVSNSRGWGGYEQEGIGYTRRQLQHGYKHANDFGVSGNPNNKTLSQFSTATQAHADSRRTSR